MMRSLPPADNECERQCVSYISPGGALSSGRDGEGAGIRTLNLGPKSPARTVRVRSHTSAPYLVGRRKCPCRFVAVCMSPCGSRGPDRGPDSPNSGRGTPERVAGWLSESASRPTSWSHRRSGPTRAVRPAAHTAEHPRTDAGTSDAHNLGNAILGLTALSFLELGSSRRRPSGA
jgi:hypothetical protein